MTFNKNDYALAIATNEQKAFREIVFGSNIDFEVIDEAIHDLCKKFVSYVNDYYPEIYNVTANRNIQQFFDCSEADRNKYIDSFFSNEQKQETFYNSYFTFQDNSMHLNLVGIFDPSTAKIYIFYLFFTI